MDGAGRADSGGRADGAGGADRAGTTDDRDTASADRAGTTDDSSTDGVDGAGTTNDGSRTFSAARSTGQRNDAFPLCPRRAGDWRNLRLAFKGAGGGLLDSQDIDLSDDWGDVALVEEPFALSLPPGTASVDATLTDSMSLTSATVNAELTPWAHLGQVCNATLTAPDPCLNGLTRRLKPYSPSEGSVPG